jgi:hypothetical protein
LTPELGAVAQRALDAAAERLYQESRHAAEPDSISEEVNFHQRRADALGVLAEAALAADLDRGSAADRYQVVLHVEAGADADASPQAVLEMDDGGVRVSADASVVVMREGADGSVLDVGRRTRTVPTPVRRALTARDSRCRFPGCTARRCDAHHITHWANGGSTSLDNLMLLCRQHHTLLHEGGLRVERDVMGGLTFVRPDGRTIELCPRPPVRSRLDLPNTGGAAAVRCWDGARFNLGYVIDVLRPQPAGWVANARS